MPVISIRVSEEWLHAVDEECSRRIWKRNAAIVNLVWMALSGSGVELNDGEMRNGTANRLVQSGRASSQPVAGKQDQALSPASPTKILEELKQIGSVRPASEIPMCKYTEYDPETGEMYGCRLPEHGPKVKHQRGHAL